MTSTYSNIHDVWASFAMNLNAYRPDLAPVPIGQPSTVPVVLLAGFLGAGKSQLLSQLLQNEHGVRIKALVNDVGSLSIDPTLVDRATDNEIILMNGCGCCDQTADLSRSLEAMTRAGDCDLVVLEGSGAADPWALSHVIEASPFVHLDRIVYVIDERDVRDWSQLDEEARERHRQRRESAHCVVISHCDDLGRSDCDHLIGRLSAELPGRTIVCSSLDAPAWHVMMPTYPVGARPITVEYNSLHEQLVVITARQTKEITKSAFLEACSEGRPGLLRAKGILRLDGVDHEAQVTPRTCSLEPYAGACVEPSITLIARRDEDLGPILACIA